MRGTPGFQGFRLHEARLARSIGPGALAQLLGVSRSTVSHWESGKATPSPAAFARLSLLLRVPESYLLWERTQDNSDPIQFRSLVATSVRSRSREEVRAEWLKVLVTLVERYVRLPTPNLPDLDLPPLEESLSSLDIESVAEEVRLSWNLGTGPISDMTLLLENAGVVVSSYPISDNRIDAHSRWLQGDDGPRPVISLNSEKGSSVRRRFDLGHELAHLLLHRTPATDKDLVKHRDRQANRFAGAFLLPADSVLSELRSIDLDSLRVFKIRWKVSIAAMIMRARQLGLITENRMKRLWQNYARRGWRKREPLDERIPFEEPRLLPRAIQTIVDGEVRTARELVDESRLNEQDFEELANLPAGFSDGGSELPEIKLLKVE